MLGADFFEGNGYRFTASEAEAVVRTLALAAGEMSETKYAHWLEKNSPETQAFDLEIGSHDYFKEAMSSIRDSGSLWKWRKSSRLAWASEPGLMPLARQISISK